MDTADPDGITSGVEGQVSGGISVIVPIERVLDIVDGPDLVAQREALRGA